MYFFKFLAGSIGLFIFMMLLGSDTGEKLLENAVTQGLALIAQITGSFSVLAANSMVTVYHGAQAVSFIIDYECSGYIELMVYLSILIFYPLFNWKRKTLYSVLGGLFIYIANLLRMLLISYSIKIFGTTVFFLSHTVFARVLFFGLMVWLYYYVFTRQHIRKQKVGDLSYD
jgi:exosortase family protein XrtG